MPKKNIVLFSWQHHRGGRGGAGGCSSGGKKTMMMTATAVMGGAEARRRRWWEVVAAHGQGMWRAPCTGGPCIEALAARCCRIVEGAGNGDGGAVWRHRGGRGADAGAAQLLQLHLGGILLMASMVAGAMGDECTGNKSDKRVSKGTKARGYHCLWVWGSWKCLGIPKKEKSEALPPGPDPSRRRGRAPLLVDSVLLLQIWTFFNVELCNE